jgi:hypothetical protein
VPSNWELQGFGSYNYGHDKVKANEQGLYKYTFSAPDALNKRVFIVLIENRESPFIVYTKNKNVYFQMLHPEREKDALKNNNVEPPFPAGDIGFLNAISAIGTKFQSAKSMGPQSQRYHSNGEPVSNTLWFDFN